MRLLRVIWKHTYVHVGAQTCSCKRYNSIFVPCTVDTTRKHLHADCYLFSFVCPHLLQLHTLCSVKETHLSLSLSFTVVPSLRSSYSPPFAVNINVRLIVKQAHRLGYMITLRNSRGYFACERKIPRQRPIRVPVKRAASISSVSKGKQWTLEWEYRMARCLRSVPFDREKFPLKQSSVYVFNRNQWISSVVLYWFFVLKNFDISLVISVTHAPKISFKHSH